MTEKLQSCASVTLPSATIFHKPARQKHARRRFTLALCGGAAALLVLLVVVGLAWQDAAQVTDFTAKSLAPSLAHPFGTDWMGRDMLTRTVAGLAVSIVIGVVAAVASTCIAIVLGAAAALGGKRVDAVVSWAIDLMMGIPHIVLLILISYALGKGFWGVAVGVALTHWPSLARIIRAEVLQCKQSGFVQQARKLGKSNFYIAVHHMVPYVIPQVIVGLVLMFPHAVLHEAAITFLGFGLPPELPSIGIILSESMGYLSAGLWWLAVLPGCALVAVVMLVDAVGSSARRMVDPRSAQE